MILSKGAHHDRASEYGPLRRRVTPEDVAADLQESLETLGTDFVDVYMLHRDDRGRPVGPIMEALNEHLRAGRIRSFGASNWTTGRLDEAARYAGEHGLEPFTSSSVQLSLAPWTEAPWPECESAHDRASLAWYERAGLPLFAWSPQAAGFFASAGDPDVVRVFDTAENRARRDRAAALGARLGVTTTQVALAWVLHRPFPTFPIVGPRTLDELRESVEALELELSADDLAWMETSGQ